MKQPSFAELPFLQHIMLRAINQVRLRQRQVCEQGEKIRKNNFANVVFCRGFRFIVHLMHKSINRGMIEGASGRGRSHGERNISSCDILIVPLPHKQEKERGQLLGLCARNTFSAYHATLITNMNPIRTARRCFRLWICFLVQSPQSLIHIMNCN